jgi:uroporphyrinogen-III synthase
MEHLSQAAYPWRVAVVGTTATTQRWCGHLRAVGPQADAFAWVATHARTQAVGPGYWQPPPTHGLLTSGQALRYVSKAQLAEVALTVSTWVTTGSTTAEALRLSLGMTTGAPCAKVWEPPQGGCSALEALTQWQATVTGGTPQRWRAWYWPTTTAASPQVAQQLAAWGDVVHRHEVYTTTLLTPDAPTLAADASRWAALAPSHVVLLSPSACHAWCQRVALGWLWPTQAIVSVGNSTAAALNGHWAQLSPPSFVDAWCLPTSTPEALAAALHAGT